MQISGRFLINSCTIYMPAVKGLVKKNPLNSSRRFSATACHFIVIFYRCIN